MRSLRTSVVAGLLLLVSACTGMQDLPLPGSSVRGDTYHLDAVFDDVLNLSEGAPVKIDGVVVGKVREVTAENFEARVRMQIGADNPVRVGSTARLRGTTPLGELYVDIDDSAAGALLADGATLGRDNTDTAPTIEDTMAAASLFINGGGLAGIQTIVEESNKALGGREASARSLLTRLTTTNAKLNDSVGDFVAALELLASVSAQLNARQPTLDAALRDIAPAAQAARRGTKDLATLLREVQAFSDTTVSLLDESSADLVEGLRNLGPVMESMNVLEDELEPNAQRLAIFAANLDRSIPTDYLNTWLHFHTDFEIGLPGILSLPSAATEEPDSGESSAAEPDPAPAKILDPKKLQKDLLDNLAKLGRLGGLL